MSVADAVTSCPVDSRKWIALKWYKHSRAFARPFLIVMGLAMLQACQPAGSPEALIEAQIKRIQAGIENKSPDDVLDPIHDEFGTAKGQDKKWLKRTMAFYMIRHEKITIVISGLDITLNSQDSARATFNVVSAGGESLIPQQAGLYKMDTDWRLENGDWQLVYAAWSHN